MGSDLVDLRRAVETARDQYYAVAMANTYGKTPEELVEIDISYQRAAKRFAIAWAAYNKAIEDEIGR